MSMRYPGTPLPGAHSGRGHVEVCIMLARAVRRDVHGYLHNVSASRLKLQHTPLVKFYGCPPVKVGSRHEERTLHNALLEFMLEESPTTIQRLIQSFSLEARRAGARRSRATCRGLGAHVQSVLLQESCTYACV